MTHKTTDEKLATARALAAAETPEERRAIREDGQESIVTETLQAGTVQRWADVFGIWHVRVSRSCVAPLLAARRGLRDELHARYGSRNVAREVWLHPLECPDKSDELTIVYREGDVTLETLEGYAPEPVQETPPVTFQISETTWGDNVAEARAEARPVASDAATLDRIEGNRPCLDADTTDEELVAWVRETILPALEENGRL